MEPRAQPSARSARRAGPGRARPRALGGRASGLRTPAPQAATARRGGRCPAGAARHSPSSLSRPPAPAAAALSAGSAAATTPTPAAALPGALAASWPRLPARAPAKAGRGAGRGAGALLEPRGGRAAAQLPQRRPHPCHRPRPCRRPRPLSPAAGRGLCPDPAPRREHRGLGIPSEPRPKLGWSTRGRGRARRWRPGLVGARGSPPHPRRRLAPPPRTARRSGACAPNGAVDSPRRARLVTRESWDELSVSWWQLRDALISSHHCLPPPSPFFKASIRVVESVHNWLRAETIHPAFEMYEIGGPLDRGDAFRNTPVPPLVANTLLKCLQASSLRYLACTWPSCAPSHLPRLCRPRWFSLSSGSSPAQKAPQDPARPSVSCSGPKLQSSWLLSSSPLHLQAVR